MPPASSARRAPWWILFLFPLALGPFSPWPSFPCLAGTITATVKPAEPIQKVLALQRDFTSTGVYSKPHEGKIDGDKITIDNLPVPGEFDLQFETQSGTVIGWNASVPASDYEEEQPLGEESRRIILNKMSKDNVTAFPDRVEIIDMQGNIQNVAVLISTLRTRPFDESAGKNESTWIWRVDRWQWEFPDEVTWVPLQERPYYALARQRLKAATFASKRVVFARHLGGIVLSADRPQRDLGIIAVPKPGDGVHAVNPDGSPIQPIVLKPRPASSPATGEPRKEKE